MKSRIETIATGDELLTGKISDTNSTFVAEQLFQKGLRLDRQTVIADDAKELTDLLQARAQDCGVLLCFGGLGPTSDDKTAECVAEMLGCSLVQHEPTKERLTKFHASRNRAVTPQSLKQVLYPEKAIPIPNPKGMAVGFSCEVAGCLMFFMPGVPFEMKAMFTEKILPEIERRYDTAQKGEILSHSWRCMGIWESEVQRLMDPIEAALPPEAWLGYRTRQPENHLVLYWRNSTPTSRRDFDALVPKMREMVKPWTYTEDTRDLELVVGEALKQKHWRIALAESCTGGLTTQRLTRIAGASGWVWGGFVTYEIAAKAKMLGVELSKPEEAVSAECTRALAKAALKQSGCEIAAAVTGYVGPTGGTERDPIGTLYLAVVRFKEGEKTGDPLLFEEKVTVPLRIREDAQWMASSYLLDLIRRSLYSSPFS